MPQANRPSSHDDDATHSGHLTLSEAYPALRNGVQDVYVYDAVQSLWHHRRLLAVWIAAFFLIGIVILLVSRREFTAEALLLPEKISSSTSGNINAGLLESFGGLLGGGLSTDFLNNDQALTSALYPDILRSTPVQIALLRTPVTPSTMGNTVLLGEYLDEHLPFSVTEGAGRAIGSVMGSDAPDQRPAGSPDTAILALSMRDKRLTGILDERLDVGYDRKTELITVSVDMPDPVVAAQTANAAVGALTTYVTDYRVKKLTENLTFLEGRYQESQQTFKSAASALAIFRDRNHNLARDIARTEEDRLEAEFNVAFSVYSSLASQVEEARIRLHEETPVFQVLQPVTVPHQKSYPQTLLVLFLSLFFGVITGICFILMRPSFRALLRLLRQSETKHERVSVHF